MNIAGFDLNQEFVYLAIGVTAFFLSKFVNKTEASREELWKLRSLVEKIEMKVDAAHKRIDEQEDD